MTAAVETHLLEVFREPCRGILLAEPTLARLAVMQIALCSAIAVGFGAISTALAEQFPVRQRSTGLALAYNVAVMLFGGFAQLIVTWLIGVTGLAVVTLLVVRTPQEEAELLARFGDDWQRYCARTGRFAPRLWR